MVVSKSLQMAFDYDTSQRTGGSQAELRKLFRNGDFVVLDVGEQLAFDVG